MYAPHTKGLAVAETGKERRQLRAGDWPFCFARKAAGRGKKAKHRACVQPLPSRKPEVSRYKPLNRPRAFMRARHRQPGPKGRLLHDYGLDRHHMAETRALAWLRERSE